MNSNFNNKITYNTIFVMLFFIFSIILCSIYFESAFAQETGRIDVIVNGHDGQSKMNTLLINSSNVIVENVTSNNPLFIFENLSLGNQYLILLNYKGVDYPVIILANQTKYETEIHVFEPTNSDENVSIDFHHISITIGENYLNVTELLQFRNFGDTVINNPDIKIEIPNNFMNFIWDQDCCLEPSDFGIFFSPIEPLMPNGSKTINFEYRLEPSSNEYSFEKRQYYDTSVVIITMDPEIGVLSSNNLNSEGLIEINGNLVAAYTSINIFTGNGFSITVSGYKGSEINLLWIGTGVLVVLGASGVIITLIRSRKSLDQLKSKEAALSSELEKIEKDFTNGNIIEVEYLQLKLKNKTELEEVQSSIQEQERVKNTVEKK